jgi:glucosamine-6-phosphate deaminase
MEVIICPDSQEAARRAAAFIASLLSRKPEAVLGLATGGTPLPLYKQLAGMHKAGRLSFAAATTFNLDEYLGLGPEHPASYRRFMEENLFSQVDINPARTHLPDGLAGDIPAHCEAYEAAIKSSGGIDAQILGIGTDGHIGFNEPSSSLASRTRIKTLTERTRNDNARFFDSPDDVPHHVITMGIGTIMEARSILLLAWGEAKAAAVAGMVEGPVTASLPASILQMHPEVKVFIDEAAAARLARRDYYRHVLANKPDWQVERDGGNSRD